jgi:methionyl-tRNA synthetase
VLKVRKLDPATFVNAYNVDLQPLYPWDGVVEPPFGAAWAVLAPGESTKPHAHQELETFFIAQGRGEFAIGDAERVTVEPGTVTFHEPFHNHTLTNTSDEPLLFLTVYWEDKGRWQGEGEGARGESVDRAGRPARTLVTAAPPTPNGDLHVGHLSGPYLAADVIARYLRLAGVDAHFVVGSDDNSVYVPSMGESIGRSGEETARTFTDEIEATLEAAGIEPTVFPRPNASPHHRKMTQELITRLHEAGHLAEIDTPTAWCDRCDRELFEPGIRGACPHCGAGVVGNTCEDCGHIYHPEQVTGGQCTTCGEPAGRRCVRRLVFPLAPWADALRDYYRHVEMSPHVRALVEGLLADGLPDVPVTQPGTWGIPVPLEGWDDRRIYVWLEMAARYFAYAAHLEDLREEGGDGGGEGDGDGWRRWWASPEAEVVQCFGYDNSFYYAMFLPAVYMALGDVDSGGVRLPVSFVTNEFYRLDGEKFSTSRDHRIMGRELTRQVPREAVRFHLAWTHPEREGTNFTLADFRDNVRRQLLDTVEGWLGDLDRRLGDERDGRTVPATGDWTADHRRFHRRLTDLLNEAASGYEPRGTSLQRAVRAAVEIAREARRFGQGERHWQGVTTRGEERRTAIALELLAVQALALALSPVTPELSGRLWTRLGYEAGPRAGSWTSAADALSWVPAGQTVGALGEPLIPGLDAALERLAT